MYTTYEKVRIESGFQSRYIEDYFGSTPTGTETSFFVRSDDRIKIVPDFSTGNTIAGVSDVQVYVGVTNATGLSRMNVSAVDYQTGKVTLDTAPIAGASLVVNYSSSPISNEEIQEVISRSEAVVNQRLAICYSLPITSTSSHLTRLATELASAFLLMRGYGTSSRDTASDGYKKYEQLMGDNNTYLGEIGLICTPNYQIVDDSGQVILRNDDESVVSNNAYVAGGREGGRLFDITEEPFRFKNFQKDVNTNQRGSGI
jgi:hypothetical protein